MEKKVLRYQMGNQNAVNRRRTDITMTKRTNNDLQNSTETEDFALRTPIKTKQQMFQPSDISEQGSYQYVFLLMQEEQILNYFKHTLLT
jgi:hypothetical protein